MVRFKKPHPKILRAHKVEPKGTLPLFLGCFSHTAPGWGPHVCSRTHLYYPSKYFARIFYFWLENKPRTHSRCIANFDG
jgi:hypothetical protein